MPPPPFILRLCAFALFMDFGSFGLSVNAQVNTNAPSTTDMPPSEDKPATSGDIEKMIRGLEKDPAKFNAEVLSSEKKAAEHGDASAEYALGIESEFGSKKNKSEAVNWYAKSANQGYVYAQVMLGACYHNGVGVEKNETTSVVWYRKAAEQENGTAECALGSAYEQGWGVQKDESEAVSWYRKAAEHGDSNAQVFLGIDYYRGTGVKEDAVEAANLLRKAAEQGNAAAQFFLGFCCYFCGAGVDKDYGAAVRWMRKAADQEYPPAEVRLGRCYESGMGVAKDKTEAFKWYCRGANHGDAEGELILGLCYEMGWGCEKNAGEAVKWLNKAAEQDNAEAQFKLGVCYASGIGVKESEVEAVKWYRMSAARGNVNASNALLPYNESAGSASRPASLSAAVKALGSGTIISSDGYILTAAHLVKGAKRIEIVTSTGKVAGNVIRIDATNDIALLKCAGGAFSPLAIAPSKGAKVGAPVFTLGFPNVQVQGIDPKFTKGEISSKNGFQDDPREWQISVPIQPGNSGGPLCDENGNLIGIVESTLNPLRMARLTGVIPQNVNYAVKSNFILPLLDIVPNLPSPHIAVSGEKFEDIVGDSQKSVVLIIVY